MCILSLTGQKKILKLTLLSNTSNLKLSPSVYEENTFESVRMTDNSNHPPTAQLLDAKKVVMPLLKSSSS